MHDQPDQLFLPRNAEAACLVPSHRRADVNVAHELAFWPLQRKREDIGGTIVALVLGIEPPHGVTTQEGDGDERITVLAPEHGLDYAPDQCARQW